MAFRCSYTMLIVAVITQRPYTGAGRGARRRYSAHRRPVKLSAESIMGFLAGPITAPCLARRYILPENPMAAMRAGHC